jgi:hypothetical protein
VFYERAGGIKMLASALLKPEQTALAEAVFILDHKGD